MIDHWDFSVPFTTELKTKSVNLLEETMEEYIDKDGVVHEHIYLLEEDTTQYLKGWYFENETYSELYGPYGTLEECKAVFKKYCEEYLGL